MAGGLDVSSRTPKQTNLFSEGAPDHAQQLHRAVGLGHVMVAAGSPRLLLVALHGKRAHGNHWNPFQIRVGLDPPGRLIAVEHRHLDVHQDEIGPVGLGTCYPGLAVGGLQHRIARAGEEGAQDAAQVLLVLDDEDALGHGTAFPSSARAGSSIWKIEPCPRVDSTQMRPPCISTICLAMASPRPLPPLALVLELSTWWNCSKMRES